MKLINCPYYLFFVELVAIVLLYI